MALTPEQLSATYWKGIRRSQPLTYQEQGDSNIVDRVTRPERYEDPFRDETQVSNPLLPSYNPLAGNYPLNTAPANISGYSQGGFSAPSSVYGGGSASGGILPSRTPFVGAGSNVQPADISGKSQMTSPRGSLSTTGILRAGRTAGNLLPLIGKLFGKDDVVTRNASMLSGSGRLPINPNRTGTPTGRTAVPRPGTGAGGGTTPNGINYDAIRARAIAPSRAIYMRAMENLDRQRALQGGYSPGYGTQLNRLARGMNQDISDMSINAEAEVADMMLRERQLAQQYELGNRALDIDEKNAPSGTQRALATANQVMNLASRGADAYSTFADYF